MKLNKIKFFWCFLKVVFILSFICEQTRAQDPINLYQTSVCAGQTTNLNCQSISGTTFTPYVSDMNFGLSKTGVCKYTPGDCYKRSFYISYACMTTAESCTINADNKFFMDNCTNQYANYLDIAYKCVPVKSNRLKEHNVCETSVINNNELSGFITSPSYPLNLVVPSECIKKIVAPFGKKINFWIIDNNIEVDIFCRANYITFFDGEANYNNPYFEKCSSGKYELLNKIQSNIASISYKVAQGSNFKIYYQIVDQAAQSLSSQNPFVPTLTTLRTQTQPSLIYDLMATDVMTVVICRGAQKVITIPKDYSLYLIDAYYGISKDQICNSYNSQDCKQPYSLYCVSSSCTVSLNNFVLSKCSNRYATYIYVQYRLIPMVSSKNYTVCSYNDINAGIDYYGVITNPGYPYFRPDQNCQRRIVAPSGNKIRIYINDFKLDPPNPIDNSCQRSFFKITTNCGTYIYCGQKGSYEVDYFLLTCSNTATITYVTYGLTDVYLRGFNLYYETISDVSNKPQTSYKITGTAAGIAVAVVFLVIVSFVVYKYVYLKKIRRSNGYKEGNPNAGL